MAVNEVPSIAVASDQRLFVLCSTGMYAVDLRPACCHVSAHVALPAGVPVHTAATNPAMAFLRDLLYVRLSRDDWANGWWQLWPLAEPTPTAPAPAFLVFDTHTLLPIHSIPAPPHGLDVTLGPLCVRGHHLWSLHARAPTPLDNRFGHLRHVDVVGTRERDTAAASGFDERRVSPTPVTEAGLAASSDVAQVKIERPPLEPRAAAASDVAASSSLPGQQEFVFRCGTNGFRGLGWVWWVGGCMC